MLHQTLAKDQQASDSNTLSQVVLEIGHLLATPGIPYETCYSTVRHNIAAHMDRLSLSNERLAPSIGTWGERLNQLRAGKAKPNLRECVILSTRFGTSLREFLTVKVDANLVGRETSAVTPIHQELPRSHRAWTWQEFAMVRSELERVARAAIDPPPSLEQVAAKCGRTSQNLRGRFPDLSRVITERHASYRSEQANLRRQRTSRDIEAAVAELLAAGSLPSQGGVRKVLHRPWLFANRWECEVLARVLSAVDRDQG